MFIYQCKISHKCGFSICPWQIIFLFTFKRLICVLKLLKPIVLTRQNIVKGKNPSHRYILEPFQENSTRKRYYFIRKLLLWISIGLREDIGGKIYMSNIFCMVRKIFWLFLFYKKWFTTRKADSIIFWKFRNYFFRKYMNQLINWMSHWKSQVAILNAVR